MIILKEGKVWIKIEKLQIGCLKLKSGKFKQSTVRLWKHVENDTKLNLDITDVNSNRLLKTISLPDKIVSVQRFNDRNYCFVLTLPHTYLIYISATNETELQELLSPIISFYQPRLTPAIPNVFLANLISVNNPLVLSESIELWIYIESEELKIYQARDLKFLLSIKSEKIHSFKLLVTDCDPVDEDKTFEITFEMSTENLQPTVKVDKRRRRQLPIEDNNLVSLIVLRLFSTKSKEIVQFYQRKFFEDEMKCEKSPKTKCFKRLSPLSSSKSLENLSGRKFFTTNFNCLSPQKSNRDRDSATSPSLSRSNVSSFHSEGSQKSPPPPLPSKEELERRENRKFMEQDSAGVYKILNSSMSKSVENFARLDSHRFKNGTKPKEGPTLPPRTPKVSDPPSQHEDQSFYKFLPSKPPDQPDHGDVEGPYKVLTKVHIPKDRSKLQLDLKPNHTEDNASSAGHYKILSPVVTPVRPKSTPLKQLPNLHSSPREVTSTNGYDVLHNNYHKNQTKPLIRISTETHV